jgi:hypothetical protein
MNGDELLKLFEKGPFIVYEMAGIPTYLLLLA